MMECDHCKYKPLIRGIHLCNATHYVITVDGAIVATIGGPHEIPAGNEEIGSTTPGLYCENCGLFWEDPP